MKREQSAQKICFLCLSFLILILSPTFTSARTGKAEALSSGDRISVLFAEPPKTGHYPRERRIFSAQRREPQCERCVKIYDVNASSPTEDAIQLVVVMERPIPPRLLVLKDPPRVVVHVEPVQTPDLSSLRMWQAPILKGPIRVGWHPERSWLRIVLDLLSDGEYKASALLYTGDGVLLRGGRFVLTVQKTVAREIIPASH